MTRQIADQIIDARGGRDRPQDKALFWAYAADAFDDEASARRYDDATRALLKRIEQGYGGLALYGGLTGAAFTLAHVCDGGVEELLTVVDAALVKALETHRDWRREYDLIGGLAGFGVYLLERCATAGSGAPEARAAITLLVETLDNLARRVASGVTWPTRPELVPAWQRARFPEGYYNLGVAHGVPGVIAVLARIATLPDAPPRAAELCADAMTWVASHMLPFDVRGRYACMLADPDVTGDDRARAAWCYGDPGIAVALWSAALRTGAPIEPWRTLALEAAGRPVELCGVDDGGLCHGAFGLAHLYNRCYQASGEAVFRDAARTWIERGLALRRPGAGVAGFVAMSQLDQTNEPIWVSSPDFLDGATGIGLALLAALRPEEPGWDRLLLCDLPPSDCQSARR